MDEFEKWWESAFIKDEDGRPNFTHFNACELAFNAGREAGMREAAAVCKLMAEKYRSADMLDCSGYILSAIGGGK